MTISLMKLPMHKKSDHCSTSDLIIDSGTLTKVTALVHHQGLEPWTP